MGVLVQILRCQRYKYENSVGNADNVFRKKDHAGQWVGGESYYRHTTTDYFPAARTPPLWCITYVVQNKTNLAVSSSVHPLLNSGPRSSGRSSGFSFAASPSPITAILEGASFPPTAGFSDASKALLRMVSCSSAAASGSKGPLAKSCPFRCVKMKTIKDIERVAHVPEHEGHCACGIGGTVCGLDYRLAESVRHRLRWVRRYRRHKCRSMIWQAARAAHVGPACASFPWHVRVNICASPTRNDKLPKSFVARQRVSAGAYPSA